MTSKTLLVVAGLVLALRSAAAAEEHAPPLAELVASARTQQRPLLLEFSAVWCRTCKLLNAELAKPEHKPLLDHFVVAHYDGERGEGQKAAARYDVRAYPTLIIVDGQGTELVRRKGFNDDVAKWLALWKSAGDLEARALEGEPAAQWVMADRAKEATDEPGQRRWLARIEADDHSPDRADAARARWQLAQLDATVAAAKAVQPILLDYLQRYPTQTLYALELLPTVGLDRKTIEATFARAVKATTSANKLNPLVYAALAAGALDAALAAAERQCALLPDDASALDTLAEACHARGDSERAIDLETKAALIHDSKLLATRRANLARFRRPNREPSPHLPSATLSQFVFGNESKARQRDAPLPPQSAEQAAWNLYMHESERVTNACAANAPVGVALTYVRLHVGASPHAEKIELLEPRATLAFQRCIDRAIREIDVPPESAAADVVVAFKMTAPAAGH